MPCLCCASPDRVFYPSPRLFLVTAWKYIADSKVLGWKRLRIPSWVSRSGQLRLGQVPFAGESWSLLCDVGGDIPSGIIYDIEDRKYLSSVIITRF